MVFNLVDKQQFELPKQTDFIVCIQVQFKHIVLGNNCVVLDLSECSDIVNC